MHTDTIRTPSDKQGCIGRPVSTSGDSESPPNQPPIHHQRVRPAYQRVVKRVDLAPNHVSSHALSIAKEFGTISSELRLPASISSHPRLPPIHPSVRHSIRDPSPINPSPPNTIIPSHAHYPHPSIATISCIPSSISTAEITNAGTLAQRMLGWRADDFAHPSMLPSSSLWARCREHTFK